MRSLFVAAFLGSQLAWADSRPNLLENASFEEAPVSGRLAFQDGGSPLKTQAPVSWEHFLVDPNAEGGRLVAGLTNETARTGKQSLFFDFQQVTANARNALLMTKPIAVKPGHIYRVSIWGRIDRQRPLTLDQRRPRMWVEIRFLAEDQKTPVGESIRGSEIIPGRIVPGGPHLLQFASHAWKETYARFATPEKAAFVRISWSLLTPAEEGTTDGIMYLDDAALVEDPDQADPVFVLQENAATAPQSPESPGAAPKEAPAPEPAAQ